MAQAGEKYLGLNIYCVRLREAYIGQTELCFEKKLHRHDKNLEIVFQYLDQLIDKDKQTEPRKRIGFKPDDGS